MKKCIKIIFNGELPEGFLAKNIQKHAKKFDIEGFSQIIVQPERQYRIYACGPKDEVDQFLDVIHKELFKVGIYQTEVEPFVKDKDYRGVFRVVE